MVNVIFLTPDGTAHHVEAQAGTTVMEAGRNSNLPGIVAECGGACACATRHVYIAREWLGKLPDKEDMEADMLEFACEPDQASSRLACQIRLDDSLDGLTVRIPENQA